MKKNMGTVDRTIRILVAVIFLLIAFLASSGIASTILIIIAVVFLLTSLISFCPLYTIFKITTKKESK